MTFPLRHWFSSWWTMAIPFFRASFRTGKADFTSVQINLSLVLLVGAEQAFIIVNLPAPFFAHQSHDRSTARQVDMVKHPVAARKTCTYRESTGRYRLSYLPFSLLSRLCSSSFRKKSDSAGSFPQKSAIRRIPSAERGKLRTKNSFSLNF